LLEFFLGKKKFFRADPGADEVKTAITDPSQNVPLTMLIKGASDEIASYPDHKFWGTGKLIAVHIFQLGLIDCIRLRLL